MPKASSKQLEYAKAVADLLQIDLPKTDDKFIIGAFIANNKEAANIRQREVNQDIYDRIKSEVKIVDIASEMGWHPRKVGSGKWYTLEEHGSVRINMEKNYYFFNRDSEKGSVIDFVVNFQDKSRLEAIKELAARIGINETYKPVISNVKNVEKEEPVKQQKSLVLPEPADNMHRMYAYLIQTRHLNPEVIQDLAKRKLVYQDKKNNAVFVSYDGEKPVFAFLKGTNTYKPFRRDAEGCDYNYGWFVPNGAKKLHITEAAIDAISKMTTLHETGQDHKEFDYLALTGTGKYNAAFKLLENGEYQEVWIATDQDEGGRKCRTILIKEIVDKHPNIKVVNEYPYFAKDLNEDLAYCRKQGIRLENAIAPDSVDAKMLNVMLEMLVKEEKEKYENTKKVVSHRVKLDEMLDYMNDYLEFHREEAIEDIKSGSSASINKILKKYNTKALTDKQIRINRQNKFHKEMDL